MTDPRQQKGPPEDHEAEREDQIFARLSHRIRGARANPSKLRWDSPYLVSQAEDFWERHLGDLVTDGLLLGVARRHGLSPFMSLLGEVNTYSQPLALGYIQLSGHINNLALTAWKPASARTQPKIQALVQLHARSIVLLEEILLLTFSGYPSGATTISRTLQEVRVTARFLHRFEALLSERFLASHIVDLWQSKADLRPRGSASRSSAWKATEKELDERYEEVLRKYGPSISIPNGWAWPRMQGRYGNGGKLPRRIPFSQLQAAAGIRFDRERYRQSSHRVHGGRLGAIQTLHGHEPEVALLGPRPNGLTDSAIVAIHDAQDITESLLRSCGRFHDDESIYWWLEALDQLSHVLRGMLSDAQSSLDYVFQDDVDSEGPSREEA